MNCLIQYLQSCHTKEARSYILDNTGVYVIHTRQIVAHCMLSVLIIADYFHLKLSNVVSKLMH